MAMVSREHLPHSCGVYVMRDASAEVLYVGKAKDLAKRVAQHFAPGKQDAKSSSLAPLVRKIDYLPCASERESLLWERRLIRKYRPFFNALWKDDKSYPYVKISLDEDFPRMLLTRQKRPDGAAYFGPYPKVNPVKNLLRYLWKRRLFPLRPCKWDFSGDRPLSGRKIHSCLYYHTRQCPAPCAGRISPDGYRRIAHEAAMFFNGRYARLSRSWRSQMRDASRRMDYERAAQLRDNLEAVEHMGERVRCEAVGTEDLLGRLQASRATTELQRALALKRPLHHIEAFDISHFSGKQTVGSMVCFVGGEPNKGHYRKFHVRGVDGIDDFRSIREVVLRRYRRLSEEKAGLPDLVLVDGGKGQLGMAAEALRELRLRIPLAALAKREEEIFLPDRGAPLLLDPADPALRLLQRLRDEAHRFALSYHRHLRQKALFRRPREGAVPGGSGRAKKTQRILQGHSKAARVPWGHGSHPRRNGERALAFGFRPRPPAAPGGA